MKIYILLTFLLACQSRMMFRGNWNGFSNIDETNPIRALDGVCAAYSLDITSLKLSPCLTDLEAISLELTKIVSSVEHPTFTSLFAILRQLELVLKDLPKTINQCMEELKPSLDEISSAFEVIRHPKSIEYHEDFALIINGVDLFHDIRAIQVHMATKNWYQAGYTVGIMLRKISMDHSRIVERFCETVQKWDNELAYKYLDSANWVLDTAVNNFLKNRNEDKLANVAKIIDGVGKFGIGMAKEFIGELGGETQNFVNYIEKMGLHNSPNFTELDMKKVEKTANKGKKVVLVYLHKKPLADNYFRTVIANEVFVDSFSQSFKFFGGFFNSSEGNKARKLYARNQEFTFALISKHGLSGLLNNLPALPELTDFLLSFSSIVYEPNKAPNYIRNNQAINFENIPELNEDNDLLMAIELSKAANKEENDEEYLKAIELSKNDLQPAQRFNGQNYLRPSEIVHEDPEFLAAIEESKIYHQENRVFAEPPRHLAHENRRDEFDNAMERYAEELRKHNESVEQNVKQYSEDRKIKSENMNKMVNELEVKDSDRIGLENKAPEKPQNLVDGLGDEPGNLPSTCFITFKLPNGQRIERRFYLKDSVEKLYLFVESKGFKNFEISQGFPMVLLNSGTLDSNNIASSTLCHVRLLA